MVHTDEMIDEELAKKLNDGVKRINKILGEDSIVMVNDKNGDGWIDIIVSGQTEYAPAEVCEAEAYVEGMEKALALQRNLAGQKAFYIVKEDFSHSLMDSSLPREMVLTSDEEKARKAFENYKEELEWNLKEDGYVVNKDTLDEFHASSEKLGKWKKVSLIKATSL